MRLLIAAALLLALTLPTLHAQDACNGSIYGFRAEKA